ncbi:hypothetical protein [Halospeciosus flavus]|uniref:RING-type E3 ubiquitin transferase n=1 Tax=Halospeciosus flavus TaxID=3032283 RepID=A0ABD5Z3E0_9EURY|nr:hypothetical protein [Halospeciosus flavus]
MPLSLTGGDLFGIGLALIGAIVAGFSARYVWRATAIHRATPIASRNETAAGTLVQISGTAQQGEADFLTAPFSGCDCLALRYAVEERRLSPLLLPWFVTIHEKAGSDTFRVQTTADVLDIVAPARTVVFARHVVASVPAESEAPERIARFEQRSSTVPSTTIWRNPPTILRPLTSFLSLGTRRYTEQRLTLGDEVTVVGRVTASGSGIDPLVVSDRSPIQTTLRMAKTALAGVLISGFSIALGVGLLAA